MRIFNFRYPKFNTYIDLDHVLLVSELNYHAVPETVKQDRDGIDYTVKSYGRASFTFQLAFIQQPFGYEIDYKEDRYEYTKGEETNKIDAVARLEAFKAEYERLLAAWMEPNLMK